MLRRLHLVQAGFAAGLAVTLPALCAAQGPLLPKSDPIPLFATASLDEKQVSNWSRELVSRIDAIWTETNRTERAQRLLRLSENTPAELAFVTRVLKRNQPDLCTATLSAVRQVFSVLRRTEWQNEDAGYVQRVVAGWSVMIPDLLRIMGQDSSPTEVRRLAEMILSELGQLSRDPRLGSLLAQQAWQPQLDALAELLRHPKPTVRLASLHVLEAIGRGAQPVAPVVTKALGDADPFVRWSAVQALKSIGMDHAALQAVATLQQDDDLDVRKTVVDVVMAQPGGVDMLAQTKNVSPVRSASLVQPRTVSTEPKRTSVAPRSQEPAKLAEPESAKPVEVMKPVSRAPESLPPRIAEKPLEVARTPSRQTNQLRHVFTSSTPSMSLLPPEAPHLTQAPSPTKPAVVPTPTPREAPQIAQTPTQVRPSVELPPPPQLARVPSQARPLFEPPASPQVAARREADPTPVVPTRPSEVRPVAATVDTPKIDMTQVWAKQLVTGSSADQVRALRELAKCKQSAAHCVPQMAELLIKGDVTVRREVPLALMEIGAPAKIATALLERALRDSDTEVKVNAARCLVEIAAK